MSERRDLLVEIGTEELPPTALKRLSEAFRDRLAEALAEAGLDWVAVHAYASPRRLAVVCEDLLTRQPDRLVERRGPALTAAFDAEGRPTRAAQGFARSCGVDVAELETLENEKGAWLVYRKVQPGRPAAALIPAAVERALAQLPIPKRMRWGRGTATFVRPVHWVVMLLGEEVVTGEILGIAAGRHTRGHRFHHPDPLELPRAGDYAPLLETRGRVLPDFQARRTAIRAQVEEHAHALGGEAIIDEALLDEVTGLVEWPVAVTGDFDPRFLALPPEVLIASMQGHQKYFPVRGKDGALLPHFVTVSNIESRDPSRIREGNERVIRPRLSDAEFFWRQDTARPLAERLEELAHIVFQTRLGSLYDKVQRVATVARGIAADLGVDETLVERAAQLAKCDLVTEMVGEFPELQGVMGRYYARHDGEPEAVAQAIDEHYWPRQAGDPTAATPVGQVLAIADRLDTLAGIFAAGSPPKGDRDPFGLRRAALGALRTYIERELEGDLIDHLRLACAQLEAHLPVPEDLVERLYDFMMERLRAYYLEQGVLADTFEAVLARRPSRPFDFHRRLEAVGLFRELPEAESLAAANKRIANILRQAEARGEPIGEVDPAHLVEPAERALYQALTTLEAEQGELIARADYGAALARLAALRAPVDRFFDEVMVMAEDPRLRANRLALLARLRRHFLDIADVSRLVIERSGD